MQNININMKVIVHFYKHKFDIVVLREDILYEIYEYLIAYNPKYQIENWSTGTLNESFIMREIDSVVYLTMNWKLHKKVSQLIASLKPTVDGSISVITNWESTYQTFCEENFIEEFEDAYRYFGVSVEDKIITFREYIPYVKSVSLVCDQNGWDKTKNPFIQITQDIWELKIYDPDPVSRYHMSRYKLYIETYYGESIYRMSIWTKYFKQENINTDSPSCDAYIILNSTPAVPAPVPAPPNLIIYECHIGLSKDTTGHIGNGRTTTPVIGTYNDMIPILPHIVQQGYNAIQLMGILEHPHYNTFGYLPTFVYAPSYRYGTYSEFKDFINTAHKLGLYVILDIIQGHSSNNVLDGLCEMNGAHDSLFTPYNHPVWGSRSFDFSNPWVVRYLCSNVFYWIKEFGIDGFRFDAITSMLYNHHGAFNSASELAQQFYNPKEINVSSIVYLKLVIELVKKKYPHVTFIAEEVSGFPGLCDPNGIGFDLKLNMGIPDVISRIIPTTYAKPPIYAQNGYDLNIFVNDIIRFHKNNVQYIESHDQAFVGTRTIMASVGPIFPDAPARMLKILKLLCVASSSHYMTFMGNEFGHPEYIEFPEEHNNYSYARCGRQWNLMKKKPHQSIMQFEKLLLNTFIKNKWYDYANTVRLVDNERQLLVFTKSLYTFIFNFHYSETYNNLEIPHLQKGQYRVAIATPEINSIDGIILLNQNRKKITCVNNIAPLSGIVISAVNR